MSLRIMLLNASQYVHFLDKCWISVSDIYGSSGKREFSL